MPPPTNPPKNRIGAWLLLAGIAVVTVAIIANLISLRFDTGETYPHYSSLRVDPLGTRALYEALARTPGVTVERNFQRLDRLEGHTGKVLVMSGLDARQFASRNAVDADAVSRFVVSGGRLVIALNPDVSMGRVARAARDAEEEQEAEWERPEKSSPPKEKVVKPTPAKPEMKPKDSGKEKDKAVTKEKATTSETRKFDPSFAETLKVSAKTKEFFYSGKEGSPLSLKSALPLTPEEVPGWRSNVYLDTTGGQDWEEDWRTLSSDAKPTKPEAAPAAIAATEPSPWVALATKGDRIMIAQRTLGSGSIVVCTDRYFLSNEALWSEPKPAFLAWLLGDATTVIFEETHLGSFIGDEDGIMTLARRYRMHGLFLGGVLLFGLFIWRSAFSLVPPTPEDDLGLWRADAVAGRSAASGLEGLLRRGLAPGKLLQRCFEVWESSRAATSAVPVERRAQAKALLTDPQAIKRPVATYRALRDALHNSRPTRPNS